MADVLSPASLSERLRLRELSKYYCAAAPLSTPVISVKPATFVADTFVPLPPSLTTDINLTALAQLAALRTGCQRAFISIIDDHAQHILAEATQSISVFNVHDHDPDDALLIGAQSLPIGYGVCPLTLDVFDENAVAAAFLDEPTNIADRDRIVIQDLLVEGKTKDRPALAHLAPILRYYVEVPLRTDTGYLLGSLCVIDPVARPPRSTDVPRLQEVAKLVMHHLQSARMEHDHNRAERLLEGLAHFVKGKDSISDWSKETPNQNDIPNVYAESTPLSTSIISSVVGASTGSTVSSRAPGSSTLSNSALDDAESTVPSSISQPDDARNVQSPAIPLPRPRKRATKSSQAQGSESHDGQSEFASTPMGTRHVFSKASNLIRESMDLDVACFLEVPHNDRFRNPRKKQESSRLRKDSKPSPPSTSDSEISTDSSGLSGSLRLGTTLGQDPEPQPGPTLCHLLGYSTRTNSSLAGSMTSDGYLKIPAQLLGRLTATYPEGRIFHFDSCGSISSSDDVLSPRKSHAKRDGNRQKVSAQLFQYCASARSMIFFPLFDNDRQQLYAGLLAWTSDPTRALQQNEIVYVSGFANSIMCEVMRMEALATDKAKSDFISSISHELRSPLHGILASAELLNESVMSPDQSEYVQMVDVCARTLLDIMNHLLDHAKINDFTRRQVQKRTPRSKLRPQPKRTGSETFSLVTDINLLSIIEETAISLAVNSNSSSSKDTNQQSGARPRRNTTTLSHLENRSYIPIILNVTQNQGWALKSEAGSWRRILMNLVGNSMKYTQQGHISIELSIRAASKSEKRHIVELRIIDTGQGISEEYLRHRLYTPFSQENNLSVGAGLGLSLVHQMVSSLNGDIQIHSEVGAGTEILVCVPVELAEPTDHVRDPLTSIGEQLVNLTQERTVTFVGFDDWPSLYEQPTGLLQPRAKTLEAMKASLSALLSNLFDFDVEATGGKVLVIERTFFENHINDYDQIGRDIVIIELEGRDGKPCQPQNANFVCLSTPIGPFRMASALKTLLEARQRRHFQHLTNDTITDGTASRGRASGLEAASKATSARVSSVPGTSPSLQSSTDPEIAPPEAPAGDGNLDSDCPPTRAAESGIAATTSAGERTLLLVDDNEVNLRILVACINRLKLPNLKYITAMNGKEALEKYIDTINLGVNIEIIFMDISMPVMDGFASTREIRAFERNRGISKALRSKIIALTGLASADARIQVENCGFDHYLTKPASMKIVREIVLDETVMNLTA